MASRERPKLTGPVASVALGVARKLRAEMSTHDDRDGRKRRNAQLAEQSIGEQRSTAHVHVCVDHAEAVRLGDDRVERAAGPSTLPGAHAALARLEQQRTVTERWRRNRRPGPVTFRPNAA